MAKQYKTIIHALRYKHWIKNSFLFAPVFFGQHLLESLMDSSIWLAFVAFCLASSTVYLFNDLIDVKDDKQNPSNLNRAYAAGRIAPHEVINLMGVLALFMFIFSLLSHTFWPIFLYLIMNIAYTLKLRQIPIVDIFILSLGFILRLWAGALSTKVPLSLWLIVITFFLALFLALGKRRTEKLIGKKFKVKVKASLSFYSLKKIDFAMYVLMAINCILYFVYCFSSEVTARFGSDKIYLTSIFVILGYFRYLFLSIKQNGTLTQVDLLLRDRYLYLIIFAWILTFYWLIYLH